MGILFFIGRTLSLQVRLLCAVSQCFSNFNRHKISKDLVRNADLDALRTKFLIEWILEKAQSSYF